MAKQSYTDLRRKALNNIESDRDAARRILMLVEDDLRDDDSDSTVRELGQVASKLIETLQRSNEQIVKLASLEAKRSEQNEKLSDIERDELFEMINNG